MVSILYIIYINYIYIYYTCIYMKFLLSPLRYFGTMVVGTPSNFSRGAFVMEYCGEVISPTQFEDRKKQYTVEKRRHYYFMSLRSDEVHGNT